jgi:hypothetical protein
MSVVDLPTTLSNADFFLQYARPGMIGLIAAEGRLVPDAIRMITGWTVMGGTGSPSLWSHSFLVADVIHEGGWKGVVITESTLIPRNQLLDGAKQLPDQPDWDGPQWSVLVARHTDGRTLGQKPRSRCRRYANPKSVSNVALIDLGLDPANATAFGRACQKSLVARIHYAGPELIGTVLSAFLDKVDKPALFNSRDVFCSAYSRKIAAPFAPELEKALRHVHESNTTCERLYLAAKDHYAVTRIVRNETPGDATARAQGDEGGAFHADQQAGLATGDGGPVQTHEVDLPAGKLPPWRRPGVFANWAETPVIEED